MINLVLANTNRTEEVINELGESIKMELASPKQITKNSKTQTIYNLKFFETDVLFYCIQNINNLIHKNKIAFVVEHEFEDRLKLFESITSVLETTYILYKGAIVTLIKRD